MSDKVFIGRTNERQNFNRVLDTLLDKGLERPFVTLLHGNGGIGKTTLSRKFLEFEPIGIPPNPEDFHKVYIDWQEEYEAYPELRNMETVTADAMLDALQKEIVQRLPNFKSAFSEFESISRKQATLQAKMMDEAKKKGVFGDIAYYSTAAGFGVVVDLMFPGTTPIATPFITTLSIVGDKLIDQNFTESFKEKVNDFAADVIGKFKADDIEFLKNYLRLKADALGKALNEIAQHKPLIVTLDTYERIDRADYYLREVIKASSHRVVWIVAGRQNIYENRRVKLDGEYKTITGYEAGQGRDFDVTNIKVSEFAVDDVKEYFEAYAMPLPDENALQHVYNVTLGIPLAVKTAAEIWKTTSNLEDIGEVIQGRGEAEIVRTMVERYLRHCPNDEDKRALYALAFSEGNGELLRAMLDLQDEDLDGVLSELALKYATVYKDEKNLHDEPAQFFKDDLKTISKEPWVVAMNQRVVAKLRQRLDSKYTDLDTLEKRCEALEWIQDRLQLIKHLMWIEASEQEVWKIIVESFVDSYIYGDFTDELAELVKEQSDFLQNRFFKQVLSLEDASGIYSVSDRSMDYLHGLLKDKILDSDYRQEREAIIHYQIGSILYAK